jgi:WD40 repeat protein
LSLNPTSVSITAGTSASTSLTAIAISGFSSQVSVQVSGLPPGVTASPASITLTVGTPQTVTLSAASGMLATTATAVFTGTSAALTHTANLGVSVKPGNTGTLSTRTKYVRTDAVVEYYQWVNTHWAVYHQPTSHFFVTDPFSNQVFVLDSKTETLIVRIPVPGAYGIDETSDQSSLYVGTLIGDIYVIDPVGMKVKHRYIASEIGPYGYQAMIALALADGRLALLGEEGGIPSVDGSSSIAVWNPTDNSITIYGAANLPGEPASPLCGNTVSGHIFGFALTSDRTTIFTGTGNSLCKLNVATGQSLASSTNGNTSKIVISPDGRYLAFPSYPNGAVLVDAITLNQVAAFNVAALNASDSSMLFTPDSTTLFINDAEFVYAYSVTTQKILGWLPNINVQYTAGGFAVGPATNPNLGAMDGTGLLVGPLEEGFGFLDVSKLQTGAVGTGFLNAYLNPATGPVAGGTNTQWSAPSTVNQVFFGGNAAPAFSVSGGFVSATTPAGQPGPADVYLFTNDGGMQLVPDGFSYGPTILEATPNFSTVEGGGTGVIYGYGFTPVNATTVPPGLSITIGGQQATIVGFNPNAYNLLSPPFLLQSIHYTIPAGTAGGAADVSVTTSSGTATAKGALSYLPPLKQFPLAGAALVQGIYDPVRDVYYFTDANKIQVFSLTQGKWLNPISIPAPTGTTQRLWGIALSPDKSKLAVADATAGVIYLIDPANPSSIKTFSATLSTTNGIQILPAGVAITDSGVAYIAVDVLGGTGYSNFYKLDTNNGVLTNLDLPGIGSGAADINLRTVISADNARVYFNVLGDIVSFDTATGAMFPASVGQGCCYGDYDLTLAPNQTQVEASSYLFDSDLNGVSALAVNDREILDISYVYGTKFSPDGSLLFQPAVQGMDIYDGRIGTLRSRIAFPIPLSTNYDALVTDGKDNVLVAITGTGGTGIAIVDLSSIGEPPPLPYTANTAFAPKPMTARSYSAAGRAPNKTQTSTFDRRVIPHVTNPNVLRLK